MVLLETAVSAPREAVDLENAIVSAAVIQDSLSRGVVAALIIRHADPCGRAAEAGGQRRRALLLGLIPLLVLPSCLLPGDLGGAMQVAPTRDT